MRSWRFDRYLGKKKYAQGAVVQANTETGAKLRCMRLFYRLRHHEPADPHEDEYTFVHVEEQNNG